MTDLDPPRGLSSARRWLYVAFLIVTAALLLSGLYLTFFYRPTAAAAVDDIYSLQDGFNGLDVRRVHNWLTPLWAILLVIVAALEFTRMRHAIFMVPALLLGGAAWLSGQMIPWDQLALWSVTTGTNMRGFEPIFGDDVRFVLINGSEVSIARIRFWFLSHLVFGSLGAAIAVVGVRFNRRRRAIIETNAA